ncbi:MAG TPA: glucose 1-dehydrogenase [Acidimicrobiia bacterium]|jgi:3alpha(or 20beta)-hydroxysteroid dehydrogenase|nr:glucose 1-dehydrogenase [Acidimicrobiia bacterium]
MGRLSGKVAVITGAARGQGEAEARRFVAEGARVVLTDVLEAEGEKVAADLGPDAVFVRHDVSREQGWVDAMEAAAAFGALTVLVNNASIPFFKPIVDTTLEEYRHVIDVNQVGAFLGIKAAIAPMIEAGGGSIINVSSIDGLGSKNSLIAYSASKFAIRGMTKTAALELGVHGIRVNSLHPGGVNTFMTNPTEEPVEVVDTWFHNIALGRVGRPEELANMALFLASDESSYCTGAEFVVDGGWTCGDLTPQLPALPDFTNR